LIYRAFVKIFGAKDSVRVTAAFLGGWLGITLAGAACGLEIGYSSSFPYGIAVTVPVMVGWHAILGILEGVITALTILHLTRRAPQLIFSEADEMISSKKYLTFRKALITTLILIFISPFFGVILADMIGYHEPLDIAAEVLNLPDLTGIINWTPFLDYTVPGLPAEVGYIIAGILGIGVILGIYLAYTRLVKQH